MKMVWGEKRGSNPRQPESQSGALASLRYATLYWRKGYQYTKPIPTTKKGQLVHK